jgi:hypothetical protein
MIDKTYLDKIARLLIDVAENNTEIHNDVKKILDKQSEIEKRIEALEKNER